ncbi:hypothetical protein F0562_027875 [Nyssa sinensis]|uniref:Uncharacterized protein n=1 Tax=Nyssa sinensis TaxID=561372 RepID=A0A5J5B8Q5_9ASTE|nr:hypothetical protein F0562_027875 [Nyssa sinensis]
MSYQGWNSQVNLSPQISSEWRNNSMKEEGPTSLVNIAADITGALPSANSIILIQSCKPDFGLDSPGDASSAESNDTSTANGQKHAATMTHCMRPHVQGAAEQTEVQWVIEYPFNFVNNISVTVEGYIAIWVLSVDQGTYTLF